MKYIIKLLNVIIWRLENLKEKLVRVNVKPFYNRIKSVYSRSKSITEFSDPLADENITRLRNEYEK